MSNNIGYFGSKDSDNGQPMCVTAFVGKDWDASVQFAIGNNYALVEEKYVRSIIFHLEKVAPILVLFEGQQAYNNGMVISCTTGCTCFEIGSGLVKFDGVSMLKLVDILQKRLDKVDGFRATD